jgi:hypothetical protein
MAKLNIPIRDIMKKKFKFRYLLILIAILGTGLIIQPEKELQLALIALQHLLVFSRIICAKEKKNCLGLYEVFDF